MNSESGNRASSDETVKTRMVVAGILAGFLLFGWLTIYRRGVAGIGPSHDVADVISLSSGWADESSCIDCHEQAEQFSETGHARTLTPATSSESLELLRSLGASTIGHREGIAVTSVDDQVQAFRSAAGADATARLDWCFGSGQHARTWVSTLPDALGSPDLLEFRWTWYHDTQDFGVTPGQPDHPGEGTIGMLGLLFDGPRAWRCFSCHSSRVPSAGEPLDASQIHAGVTCQRCHGPRADHVDSEGEYHDPVWTVTDREEAVNRCGQCHRRADEQALDTIRAGNPDIVRFQPVGLSQSACYINSQMSCTTCHDPHRSMASQDSRRIQQCVKCHDPEQTEHVLCAASMTDNCLACHMPTVQSVPGLSFTDHWIRVPDTSELQP
jgi:Cytochrome c554 and c-prime